jgi:hypothetical protein
MSIVIKNDDLNIIKDTRNGYLYTIEFKSYSESIIKSLIKTKIIVGASVSSNYRTMRLKASSIQTLKQFQEEQKMKNGETKLRIPIAFTLLANLASQLKYLITEHLHCFIGYSPENVIVIDGNKFVYLSNQHISDIHGENIQITFPFYMHDFFLSPEQNKITEIPSYIHYKTSYYSLACLVIYSLANDDYFLYDENRKTMHERFTEQLENLSIVDTKLYWLLKKSLVEEPKDRKFLFI